jgi:hypothetical protein
LLAGVGHVTEPPDAQRNFLVVDHKTESSQIERAFTKFTKERKDIGIILINQHVRLLLPTDALNAVPSIGSKKLCNARSSSPKDEKSKIWLCIRANFDATARLRNEFGIKSIPLRTLSPQFSKSPAKIIHMTRKRTVSYAGSGGYLENEHLIAWGSTFIIPTISLR